MMESMMNQTTPALRKQPLLAQLAAFVWLCAVTLLSPAAIAQSANEILDQSRDALLESPGFQAQFRMKGEGGSMFADTMPSLSGQLFFGTSEELGRVIRTMGEGKDKQSEPSKPLDQLIAQDRFIWVDRQKQTITEAPNKPNARGVPSSLSLVLLSSIINGDPYGHDLNGAESVTLGAQEEVAGELCDQVIIKRPQQQGRSRAASQSYTDAVWWISTKDKLPRKVQHITDAGLVKITLEFEMSNLRIAAPNEKQLDVARPNGFEFISKMPRQPVNVPTDKPVNDTPVNNTSTQTNDTPPATAKNPEPTERPVTYSFSTSDGTSVDNTTQQGRVTVLYFMGSWCVPCGETSALIETMRSELEVSDVDIFALGIREGDPERVQRTFNTDYPSIPISVNPDGMTPKFKVRIYPTIVVLDRDGINVYQKPIGKNFGPDKLVEEVTEAVSDALTGG